MPETTLRSIRNQNSGMRMNVYKNTVDIWLDSRDEFKIAIVSYCSYYNNTFNYEKNYIATPFQIFAELLNNFTEILSLDITTITKSELASWYPTHPFCVATFMSSVILKSDGRRLLPGDENDPYLININENIGIPGTTP